MPNARRLSSGYFYLIKQYYYMSKDKMTPTPWNKVDPKVHLGEIEIMSSVNTPGTEKDFRIATIPMAYYAYNDHRISEEEAHANASAIVSAVNGTWGIGVHPDAVKDLFEALEAVSESLAQLAAHNDIHVWMAQPKAGASDIFGCIPAFDLAKAAINKSKLATHV